MVTCMIGMSVECTRILNQNTLRGGSHFIPKWGSTSHTCSPMIKRFLVLLYDFKMGGLVCCILVEQLIDGGACDLLKMDMATFNAWLYLTSWLLFRCLRRACLYVYLCIWSFKNLTYLGTNKQHRGFDKLLVLLFSFLDLTTLLYLFPLFIKEFRHICSVLLIVSLFGLISPLVGIFILNWSHSSFMTYRWARGDVLRREKVQRVSRKIRNQQVKPKASTWLGVHTGMVAHSC